MRIFQRLIRYLICYLIIFTILYSCSNITTRSSSTQGSANNFNYLNSVQNKTLSNSNNSNRIQTGDIYAQLGKRMFTIFSPFLLALGG
jgi:hypothetical protein